nr:MAG: ORF1 [TTV-like mini virus]
MPPFRRFWYYRRRYNNRRRPRRYWNRRRRIRRTLQTRYRPRRRWVRKFKKRIIKRKRKYLKINQWQPKTIKKCKITGYKCLFWAGPDRDSNNYAQYQQSYTNPHQSGGGGWSMLVFSLSALWEEHMLDRNWWTTGNKGLPLVRYNGCKFTFFREEYIDYAVQYSLCYPMIDGKYMHANCAPYNMMLQKNRFIVLSKRNKPNRKPYVKKRFKPPAELFNKWYFQRDFCETGLIMLNTTAISTNYMYLSPIAYSNCISLYVLDPKIFKKNGWIHPQTNGYSPTGSTYYYCLPPGSKGQQVKNLTYLGRPGPYDYGTPFGDISPTDYTSQSKYWGNIFHPDVLLLNIPVYLSTTQPSTIFTENNRSQEISQLTNGTSPKLTRVTNPFIKEIRYNPDADTGDNTVIYLYSVERDLSTEFPIPADPNYKIEGFPLHLGLWGWLDWQKKLKLLHNIDTSYITVIRSPYTEPKEDYLLCVDKNFLDGKGPYGIPHSELNTYSLSSWWPKVAHQMVSINNICHAGPGTCKYEKSKCIQAHCKYNFYFRWGGCPAPMVDLTNPCLQPKHPLPSTIVQRLQVQDPKLKPELELHDFDQRQEMLTKRCIDRIKKHTDFEQTIIPITGSTNPPTKTQRQRLQETLQTSESEEEEPTLQQQLRHQLKQQRLLKRAILQLMDKNIE